MFSKLRHIARSSKAAYQHCLTHNPYATQAVQVSLMMGAGDIFAQSLVEKVPLDKLNLRRTAEFSCLGLVLVGPTLRFWYGKLDRIVAANQAPWKRTLKKTAADQLLFAPAFIVLFTSSISFMQGMSVKGVVGRLKKEYPSILMTNYIIWPTAQVINFALVPLNFQVVFVQCVAILWNTYLSLKLGSKAKDE